MARKPPPVRGLLPVGGKAHQVRVVETGQVFPSMQKCAKAIGGHISAISEVVNGNRRQHKGFTFERVEQ